MRTESPVASERGRLLRVARGAEARRVDVPGAVGEHGDVLETTYGLCFVRVGRHRRCGRGVRGR